MAIDLDQFPTSESAKKMLSYVSDGFYDNSYVGKWLYQVMGQEYDTAFDMVESLPYQLFPETATWGLMFHEIKWGLPVKNDVASEERRKLIYQKRDIKRPMTPYQMEKAIEYNYDCKAYVSDVHDAGSDGYTPSHPNIFRVLIETDGEKLDTHEVTEKIKALKQSHTQCEINYNLWRKITGESYYAGVVTKIVTRRFM